MTAVRFNSSENDSSEPFNTELLQLEGDLVEISRKHMNYNDLEDSVVHFRLFYLK